MKKHFLSIVSAICFSAAAIAQIPNAGFETWDNMGSYQNPDGWSTMNNLTSTQSMFTATKGTPGSPGSSYLKLTSKTVGATIVPGIAVSGRLDTMSMLPISGVPFAQRPASFTGKWQHMLFGNSAGSVMVLLTKWNPTQNTRDTVAHGLQGLSSMVMSWTNFAINLNYMDSLNYPDSCIIVLNASGPNPSNNDYLWVDNLAFTGTVAVSQSTIGVGIKENVVNNPTLGLCPNPALDQVTVSYNLSLEEKISLQILDLNGKVVKDIRATNSIGTNTLTVETNRLTKGIYSVVLKTNSSINSSKLVIE